MCIHMNPGHDHSWDSCQTWRRYPMSPWVIHIKHLVHHFQACNQILVFFLKMSFLSPQSRPAVSAGFWPVYRVGRSGQQKKLKKPDFCPDRVWNRPKPAGLDWGLRKLNLKKKNRIWLHAWKWWTRCLMCITHSDMGYLLQVWQLSQEWSCPSHPNWELIHTLIYCCNLQVGPNLTAMTLWRHWVMTSIKGLVLYCCSI